jgi:hypothetical protein
LSATTNILKPWEFFNMHKEGNISANCYNFES